MPTLDLQVAANANDESVYWTGSAWILDPNTIATAVGYDSATINKIGAGHRFTNVTIPQNANIDTAYMSFLARVTRTTTPVYSRIRGEAADNASQFSTASEYNARTRTSASVDWDNMAAWTAGTWYNSPEIKTVIQEIVNRAGWVSGQSLVLFWDDHDGRTTDAERVRESYQYEQGASSGAKLHIEYGSMFYNIDPLTRVSGIRWVFDASLGKIPDYYMEILLGGVTTAYVPAMTNAKPTPAIPLAIAEMEKQVGPGLKHSDYEKYMRVTDVDRILRIFGRFPSYTEWLNQMLLLRH